MSLFAAAIYGFFYVDNKRYLEILNNTRPGQEVVPNLEVDEGQR